MSKWMDHVQRWQDCQRCPLGQQRDRICLARGIVPCTVLFIGEAPGASEDALGQPFVGPAGKLLDEIVARAIPHNVPCAYTNLVACYPRDAKSEGHNEPEHGEILECRERLVDFVAVCQPKLVVRVGKLASTWAVAPVVFSGVDVCDIDHPARILRMPIAQRGMAVRKCVVVVVQALDDLRAKGVIQ